MPQDNLVIANGSGATVRGKIGTALAALGTLQKGPSAPSGVAAGWLWLDDDTPSATIWTLNFYDGTTWIPMFTVDTVNDTVSLASAQVTNGFRNQLLNGGFEVWQRGITLAIAAASYGYTADRWSLLTGASANCTVSRQAGLTSASRYAARVQRDSGQSGTGDMVFEQAFETADVIRMRGRKLSVRFDARKGANFSGGSSNVLVRVYAGTGTEARRGNTPFTAETTLLNTTANLGTSSAGFTFTTSAAVPAGATQLSFQIVEQPSGTAGANDWFEIDSAQVEISDVPTAYEERPIAAELAMLQRFYREQYTAVWGAAGIDGVDFIALQPPMRAAPAIGNSLVAQLNCSTWTAMNASPNAVQLNATFTGTAGYSNRVVTLDAELT